MKGYRRAVICALASVLLAISGGVCFALGLNPKASAISYGGSTQITAGGATPYGTVYWSVISGPGYTTYPSSQADSTGTAYMMFHGDGVNYGIATIQAQDEHTGQTATCQIKLFKVTQSRRIYWFAGVSPDQQPAGYPLEATLTANATSTGTFKWQIVAGGTYAGFWDGSAWLPNPTIKTNSNTITLRAKGPIHNNLHREGLSVILRAW